MKKRSMFMVAAAAIALLSCNKAPIGVEEEEVITQPGSRTVVFSSEMFESKTSISGNRTDGYKSNWSVGDRIDVFENGKVYSSEPLEGKDIINGVAHFTVVFDKAEDADVYRYVAVYPSRYYDDGGNDGPVLSSVITKANGWVFDDNYYFDEDGYYLSIYINNEQCPSADSFDPSADYLISKEIKSAKPISEVGSLQFARIGSMMKITLKGLNDYVGSKVESARIEWNWETHLFGWGNYSSEEEKYMNDGSSSLSLYPEDTYVKSDGTVDLWIRCYEGQEDTSMEVNLELEKDGEQIRLARYVDLEAMDKTLEFKEGHLAEFSVGGFLLDDIDLEQGKIVFRNTPDGNSVVFSWMANEFAKEYECYVDSDFVGLAEINDGIASVTVLRSSLPEDIFYFGYYVTAIDGHYSPVGGGYKIMNSGMNLLDGGVYERYGSIYASSVTDFLHKEVEFNTNYYYVDETYNEWLGFRNVMMDRGNFSCCAADTELSDGWKIWSVLPHKKMIGVKIILDHPSSSDVENIRVYGASVPGGMNESDLLQLSKTETEYMTTLYYYFDETSDLSYYTITSDNSLEIWSISGLYDF